MQIRGHVGLCLLMVVAALGVVVASPRVGNAQQADLAPFRIVVIPDTQVYSESDDGATIALAQFEWVVDTAPGSNTVFVSHVGDVVERPNDADEWNRMEPGFDLLDAASIPYAIAPGNHDILGGGGSVLYDSRFPASRFEGQAWFGGSHEPEGNRSSWQTISVDGHELLFIHARHLLNTYGDVAAVVAWIDALLAAHPDHLAIVSTHQFTETDGSIGIPELAAVLDDHCNVALVLSGHRLGESVRGTFVDACGRSVIHLMTNYQFIENGGNGFLRTLDIDPLTLVVESRIYSPTLDVFRAGPDEAFTASFAKLPAVPGDADCDRSVDVADAMAIVQYQVGSRSDRGSCPLAAPPDEVDASAADVNDDGMVTITDALLIAQCAAAIENQWCPAPPQ